MSFKDKYQREGDTDPKKETISKEAFAIGELLDELINELRRGNILNG